MSLTVTVSAVETSDLAAISDLHARVFGPGRFTRTAYRIREGTPPFGRFCRKATLGGRLIAAVRQTDVNIGGAGGAVMLGPLAVEPEYAGLGHGKRLVRESLELMQASGIRLVILVGNEPYYGRFGFVRVPRGQIVLPGPVDANRLLAAELEPEALARYHGLVTAARLAPARPLST